MSSWIMNRYDKLNNFLLNEKISAYKLYIGIMIIRNMYIRIYNYLNSYKHVMYLVLKILKPL